MSEHNACDVAQGVHESVLKSGGALPPHGLLRGGQPLPPGPWWMGIYLDDLVVLEKARRSASPSPEVDALLPKSHAAYEKSGLSRDPSKGFKHQLHFRAWGAEVDGDLRTVAAPWDARLRLAEVVSRLPREPHVFRYSCRGCWWSSRGPFSSAEVFRVVPSPV